MKRIPFYAAREDILPVLETVEQHCPLQYVRTGNQTDPKFATYLHGRDLPGLGVADRETGVACESYLVTRAAVRLTVRQLTGIDGVQRYLMDQLVNADTVRLIPAGLSGEDVVLEGIVDTVSDSPIAQELMKQFHAAFRQHFTKVRMFRVGPQAYLLFQAGKWLTGAAQSPPEFDLTLPEQDDAKQKRPRA